MEKTELISLCSENKKLSNLLKKIISSGVEIHIDDTPKHWDVEIAQDFDNNTIALVDEDDTSHDAGWGLFEFNKDFSKLLGAYEWDNLKLSDGRVLFLIDFDKYSILHVLLVDKMINGAVECISWGSPFKEEFLENYLYNIKVK